MTPLTREVRPNTDGGDSLKAVSHLIQVHCPESEDSASCFFTPTPLAAAVTYSGRSGRSGDVTETRFTRYIALCGLHTCRATQMCIHILPHLSQHTFTYVQSAESVCTHLYACTQIREVESCFQSKKHSFPSEPSGLNKGFNPMTCQMREAPLKSPRVMLSCKRKTI